MHISSSPQQGGSGAVQLEKVKDEANVVNETYQGFTMSPKQFKDMLKKLSVCPKN